MTDISKALFDEFTLHLISLPHLGVRPLDVQIREDGRTLPGRFKLSDVFEGDFADIAVNAPSAMPDVTRALASATSAALDGKLAGPLGLLGKANAELSAEGVKRLRLTAFSGLLEEVDVGALHRAIANAKVRQDGPLKRGRSAIVLVAVASLKTMSIGAENEVGGTVKVAAQAVDTLSGGLGATVKSSSSSDLQFDFSSPMPFAARAWTVKQDIIGRLRIMTPTGPFGVLGDGATMMNAEFAKDLGSDDPLIEL